MFKNTSRKAGFTLIELLVVIAIISILSAVVLASLNTSRLKATDTTILGNLNNARAQADLYYTDNNNTYSSVCTAGNGSNPPGIASFLEAADDRNGAGAVNCYDASEAGISVGWAAEAALVSSTTYFCIDHTGQADTYSASSISNADAVCGP